MGFLHRAVLGLLAASCLLAVGCGRRAPAVALSRASDAPPAVPVPPPGGPELAVTAAVTPVVDRPGSGAVTLGYLHAGARVTRAEQPFSSEGCPSGLYPIRPRGLVCLEKGATLDLTRAGLSSLAAPPRLDGPLPYTYAKARSKTALYAAAPEAKGGFRVAGELAKNSVLAVVGSSRRDDGGKPTAMAMTSDGRFVVAADLEPVREIDFHGVELGEGQGLPVAFAAHEGITPVRYADRKLEHLADLPRLTTLALTGKFHTKGPEKYWALADGTYVRNRDIALVLKRDHFPEFVGPATRWIDISTVAGTLVLYEGKKAVFATLVSLLSDRHGDPHPTQLGTFFVTGKQITAAGAAPGAFDPQTEARDVPWVVDISSGQSLVGAYWHERFGLERGSGSVHLSPADARRVWGWVEAPLPPGWHGAESPDGAARTVVLVRK